MESNKAEQNRVPVINDVAAKEAPSPKPGKVAKAEKSTKPGNVKVVDVVLKQSSEKSPQHNAKPTPKKENAQPTTVQSEPLTAQPTTNPPITKQPSPNPQVQPTTNPPPKTQPAAQQPTPSEPIDRVKETSPSSSPSGPQPPPSNEPPSKQPSSCQLETSKVVANQESENKPSSNHEPETQQPPANPAQPPKSEPQLNGEPVLEQQTACAVSQSQVLPQAPAVSNHVPVQSVPLPSAAVVPTKVHKHKDEKHKKEDKSVTQMLKSLNSLNTTEEKLAALCKKYADMFDENRKLQLLVKQSEKKVQLIHREKEQLQSEHSKAILTRSRLESLCRELQKQNKAIKEESIAKMREEEEKRTEISAKFQNTLSEITTLMQQNNEKNNKLRDDNVDMTSRLKSVCEQYQLREQQVEKLGKQMELEVQLCDAKLAKAKMEMTAEKEILLREKQQLLLELTTYQNRCQELQGIEVDLRNQIALYNDKYDEFQQALSKSSDVFTKFKGEMDKMSKKITKLEKETSTWKKRWEQSHQAVLEMAVDKQVSDQELKKTSRQLQALQNLCRTLQTERAQLLGTVKKLTGGGELSEAEKMVTTENGCEAIETLMTKIENECDTEAKQETPRTNQVDAAPVLPSVPSPAPQADVHQPTQCVVPAPVADEKTSKNQANNKSKTADQCDKVKTCKVKEQALSTNESPASVEASSKSVDNLVSAVSPDKPSNQSNGSVSAESMKNENKCTRTPSAPIAEEPQVPERPIAPAVEVPQKTGPSGTPESAVTPGSEAVDSNPAGEIVPPKSDMKPEVDASEPQTKPTEEKSGAVDSSPKDVSCPIGSAAKTCDKKEKERKLVPEQKKKESSKKRKK